jgi:hypothetical protein
MQRQHVATAEMETIAEWPDASKQSTVPGGPFLLRFHSGLGDGDRADLYPYHRV